MKSITDHNAEKAYCTRSHYNLPISQLFSLSIRQHNKTPSEVQDCWKWISPLTLVVSQIIFLRNLKNKQLLNAGETFFLYFQTPFKPSSFHQLLKIGYTYKATVLIICEHAFQTFELYMFSAYIEIYNPFVRYRAYSNSGLRFTPWSVALIVLRPSSI